MPQFGEVRVDFITFTTGVFPSEANVTASVSGLIKNPTFSGDVIVKNNLDVEGNITTSGTVAGTTAGFTSITGTTVAGITAGFTSITGTTVTGNTGNFTTVTTTTANVASGIFASGTVTAPSVSVGTTGNGVYSPDANQVAISTNGTGRLFLDDNGKVGIGVTSRLNAKLHVENGEGDCIVQIISDTDDSSIIRLGDKDDINIGKIKYNHSNNSLAFDTDDSTRLRIDSNGNLIVFGGNITNGSPAIGTSGFDLQDDGPHKLGRDAADSLAVLQVFGGSGEAKVKGNGDLQNTLGNYDQISSDERLKENIVDASSQWEDIKGIRFRNFNYISNPNTRILGCVAQELQQVCPNLIKTRPASEEEIADNSNTISEGDQVLSFKQIPLLLKAAKALQEAMERIETLEAKVAALEAGN